MERQEAVEVQDDTTGLDCCYVELFIFNVEFVSLIKMTATVANPHSS